MALGVGGVGGWGWGVVGGAPYICAHACACTHAHTCTCTRGKHDNLMQNGHPHWGNPWEFPMMSYMRACACACTCMHACACACACGWDAPSHHLPPPSTHPPIPQGWDPWNYSKFNSTWTNQDISILFKDLKFCGDSPPPMDGCIIWWVLGGWVGWWVGSGQITKNLKIVD